MRNRDALDAGRRSPRRVRARGHPRARRRGGRGGARHPARCVPEAALAGSEQDRGRAAGLVRNRPGGEPVPVPPPTRARPRARPGVRIAVSAGHRPHGPPRTGAPDGGAPRGDCVLPRRWSTPPATRSRGTRPGPPGAVAPRVRVNSTSRAVRRPRSRSPRTCTRAAARGTVPRTRAGSPRAGAASTSTRQAR